MRGWVARLAASSGWPQGSSSGARRALHLEQQGRQRAAQRGGGHGGRLEDGQVQPGNGQDAAGRHLLRAPRTGTGVAGAEGVRAKLCVPHQAGREGDGPRQQRPKAAASGSQPSGPGSWRRRRRKIQRCAPTCRRSRPRPIMRYSASMRASWRSLPGSAGLYVAGSTCGGGGQRAADSAAGGCRVCCSALTDGRRAASGASGRERAQPWGTLPDAPCPASGMRPCTPLERIGERASHHPAPTCTVWPCRTAPENTRPKARNRSSWGLAGPGSPGSLQARQQAARGTGDGDGGGDRRAPRLSGCREPCQSQCILNKTAPVACPGCQLPSDRPRPCTM